MEDEHNLPGRWPLVGCVVLGDWMLDSGYWVLDNGYWMLDNV